MLVLCLDCVVCDLLWWDCLLLVVWVYFIVCVLAGLRAFEFVRDLIFGDVGYCLK